MVIQDVSVSFDELYGIEESKRIRSIQKEMNSGENNVFGRKAKGKTYEEIYGKEKALMLKQMRSRPRKKRVSVAESK